VFDAAEGAAPEALDAALVRLRPLFDDVPLGPGGQLAMLCAPQQRANRRRLAPRSKLLKRQMYSRTSLTLRQRALLA
jgi:hypothetical protein